MTLRFRLVGCFYIGFCLLLTGCATNTPIATKDNSLEKMAGRPNSSSISSTQTDSSDLQKIAVLWQTRTQESAVKDYPIGPGDVLQISVPAMEELKDRNVRVTAEGTILLPLLGKVQVAGLNEAELVEKLRPGLNKYLRNPRVFIFVKEYNSRQVAVLGAVKQPGLYTLSSGSENILDMISRAGGMAPDAEPEIQLIPTEPLKPDAIKEVVSDCVVVLLRQFFLRLSHYGIPS